MALSAFIIAKKWLCVHWRGAKKWLSHAKNGTVCFQGSQKMALSALKRAKKWLCVRSWEPKNGSLMPKNNSVMPKVALHALKGAKKRLWVCSREPKNGSVCVYGIGSQKMALSCQKITLSCQKWHCMLSREPKRGSECVQESQKMALCAFMGSGAKKWLSHAKK